MDNKFAAIVDPDARQINDSRQRALVKALAFAGLGLNLWSDSDVPVGFQGKTITPEQVGEIDQLLAQSKANREKFLDWAGVTTLEDMPMEKYPLAISTLKRKLSSHE